MIDEPVPRTVEDAERDRQGTGLRNKTEGEDGLETHPGELIHHGPVEERQGLSDAIGPVTEDPHRGCPGFTPL